jgi:hypothetical protein
MRGLALEYQSPESTGRMGANSQNLIVNEVSLELAGFNVEFLEPDCLGAHAMNEIASYMVLDIQDCIFRGKSCELQN